MLVGFGTVVYGMPVGDFEGGVIGCVGFFKSGISFDSMENDVGVITSGFELVSFSDADVDSDVFTMGDFVAVKTGLEDGVCVFSGPAGDATGMIGLPQPLSNSNNRIAIMNILKM